MTAATASPPASRRPLSATVWFAWTVAVWVVFLGLLLADRLDDVWGWVRGLPLLLEAVAWVTFLPWLLATAVWTSSWGGLVRAVVVGCIAATWIALAVPRRRKATP